LGDYFNLELDVTVLIDFGNVATLAKQVIDDIKTNKKNKAPALFKQLIHEGAEVTAICTGKLVINLQELTKGLLKNFSFTIEQTNVLLTLSGGASGLPIGFYVLFNSDVDKALVSAISSVVDNFSGILEHLGINTEPKVSSGTTDNMGFFINEDAAGFQINCSLDDLKFDIRCMFNFHTKKFSCKFNSNFFTIIGDAGKWVIKEAKKLFDETGKEIVRIDQDLKDLTHFGKDVAKAVVSKINTAISKGTKKLDTKVKGVLDRLGRKLKKH